MGSSRAKHRRRPRKCDATSRVNRRQVKEAVFARFPFLARLYNRWAGAQFRAKDAKTVFSHIYSHNLFQGGESISGPGSSLEQTAQVRAQLPALMARHRVKVLIDAPCGDFHWLRSVIEASGLSYVGLDIVEDLIEQNQRSYAGPQMSFMVADITQNRLPPGDCLMCRDCLVHLSNLHASAALRNFKRSGIPLLLTTTYPQTRSNIDILTGMWRPVNLQMPPFGLPQPIDSILEQCTEAGGLVADKTLALFDLRTWSPPT